MSDLIRKQTSETPRTEADGAVRFVASTESQDRDGDVIRQSGWRLANYRQNPVILWAHDYATPPIGRAREVAVRGGRLEVVVEFPPAGLHPLADSVAGLTRAGFVSATSVGFRPTETRPLPGGRGVEFVEAELLEISIVPVPANAEALVQARGARVDGAAVSKWLRDAAAGSEDGEAVLELLDDPPRTPAAGDDDAVLWLADDPPHDPAARHHQHVGAADTIDVDPRELRDGLARTVPGLVQAELRQVVAREVAASLRRARGRLD